MKWMVIAQYSFPYEAHIAKARLESVGISAHIENEHTINMYWLYSNALGGVRVLVPDEQVDTARYLISQDFSQDLDDELNLTSVRCPKCNSTQIEPFTQGKKAAFIAFFVINVPLFIYKHGMRCKACQHFFN